jgi:hypothetical protein
MRIILRSSRYRISFEDGAYVLLLKEILKPDKEKSALVKVFPCLYHEEKDESESQRILTNGENINLNWHINDNTCLLYFLVVSFP